jgi:hypothetical protein
MIISVKSKQIGGISTHLWNPYPSVESVTLAQRSDRVRIGFNIKGRSYPHKVEENLKI